MRFEDGEATAMRDDDFVEEMITERTRDDPHFATMVDRAVERRQFLRALGTRRERLGLTQTAVAARMGTSQSSVARIEAGEVDARLSTIDRYAAAIGHKVVWQLVPENDVSLRAGTAP
jgi:DNA-binding XRE family transcriptional regulator